MNDFPISEILVDSIRDDIKSAQWEIEGEKVSFYISKNVNKD